MALIEAMPSATIIEGLWGKLDFYKWCGLNIVRSWPRYRSKTLTEPTKAQWPAFSYVNKIAGSVSPEVRAAYQKMASGTGLSWKDYLVRGYISGIYRQMDSP